MTRQRGGARRDYRAGHGERGNRAVARRGAQIDGALVAETTAQRTIAGMWGCPRRTCLWRRRRGALRYEVGGRSGRVRGDFAVVREVGAGDEVDGVVVPVEAPILFGRTDIAWLNSGGGRAPCRPAERFWRV